MNDELKRKLLLILNREGFHAVLDQVAIEFEKQYDKAQVNTYRQLKTWLDEYSIETIVKVVMDPAIEKADAKNAKAEEE